jgi:branched-chain amino acid transport system substrate-binding protein
MLRARLLAILVLAVALCIAATTSCAPQRDDEIRIGAYLSLTGADSTFGTDTRAGIELAVDEVNRAGGIRGKKVRLLVEDDKSLPNETAQKVQQLIDRDHVEALLGEVASSRSMIGGLIANTRGVPMVSPSSTAVDVTRGRPWVFRACFTDAQQGDVAARFVFEKLGKRKVGLLYVAQDTYSSGLAATFRWSFERLGGEIVAAKAYPLNETNYSTYLRELKAASPEVLFVPVYYKDMVPIARQAKAEGLDGSMFVGGDAWDSDVLLAGAGAELEGAHFTNSYAPDAPWEGARAFVATYRARVGREVSGIGAQGYDGAKLLLDAIARAGSESPDAIRDALASTRDFRGATGKMTIDENHDANKPVVIVRITDGAFRYADEVLAQPMHGAPLPLMDAVPKRAIGARDLSDALLTGLAQGAMIALVALGYTMVFGVLKMINFAHSEVLMMSAYAGLFAIGAIGAHVPPVAAAAGGTVLAMIAAALLGATIERVAYRPLRTRARGPQARITPLVTALAVSVLLQNAAQLLFTARYRPYPRVFASTRPVIVATAVIVMIALELLVKRTWFGKSLRALSTNEEAARLMGVDTSRVIGRTFALGSALAAIGAVLYCLDQSQVYPTMGLRIGTQAFVAAVVGGIGSLPGAMLGGLVLGVLGELAKLTDYSGGAEIVVFFVLIVVLLVKPTGLLGSIQPAKV